MTVSNSSLSADNVKFIRSCLERYSVTGKVNVQSIVKPSFSMSNAIRFSVPFKTDAIYNIIFDVHYTVTGNNLFNVFLDGKVSLMYQDSKGRLRWKRDVEGATFSGNLGVVNLQTLAQTLENYTQRLCR